MIIIAQRLSTVEDCDLLLWLEKGVIHMIDVPDGVLPNYRYDHSTHRNHLTQPAKRKASTQVNNEEIRGI